MPVTEKSIRQLSGTLEDGSPKISGELAAAIFRHLATIVEKDKVICRMSVTYHPLTSTVYVATTGYKHNLSGGTSKAFPVVERKSGTHKVLKMK